MGLLARRVKSLRSRGPLAPFPLALRRLLLALRGFSLVLRLLLLALRRCLLPLRRLLLLPLPEIQFGSAMSVATFGVLFAQVPDEGVVTAEG